MKFRFKYFTQNTLRKIRKILNIQSYSKLTEAIVTIVMTLQSEPSRFTFSAPIAGRFKKVQSKQNWKVKPNIKHKLDLFCCNLIFTFLDLIDQFSGEGESASL
ncbi:MAG: hypothetical protein B0A82_01900 [Alkalinema sp. CACIAM 70d]|nr:MAG: hypothetical protein B0A82_01900 [Alkalinema sp. CACIAM 70d]